MTDQEYATRFGKVTVLQTDSGPRVSLEVNDREVWWFEEDVGVLEEPYKVRNRGQYARLWRALAAAMEVDFETEGYSVGITYLRPEIPPYAVIVRLSDGYQAIFNDPVGVLFAKDVAEGQTPLEVLIEDWMTDHGIQFTAPDPDGA